MTGRDAVGADRWWSSAEEQPSRIEIALEDARRRGRGEAPRQPHGDPPRAWSFPPGKRATRIAWVALIAVALLPATVHALARDGWFLAVLSSFVALPLLPALRPFRALRGLEIAGGHVVQRLPFSSTHRTPLTDIAEVHAIRLSDRWDVLLVLRSGARVVIDTHRSSYDEAAGIAAVVRAHLEPSPDAYRG